MDLIKEAAIRVKDAIKGMDSGDVALVLRQALTGQQAAACVYLLADTAKEMKARKGVITIKDDGGISLEFIAGKGKGTKVTDRTSQKKKPL